VRGRCGVTRRSFRGVSVGPDGQMDVWLRSSVLEFHNLTRGMSRNSSILRCAPGFRPIALSSRFGSQARRLDEATSASGRATLGDSRGHTLKAWPSSTGRATAPDSVPHAGPETRCSCQRSRRSEVGPSSLHCRLHCHFPCGRPTRVHLLRPGSLPDKLTSGHQSSRWILNGSRHTMGA